MGQLSSSMSLPTTYWRVEQHKPKQHTFALPGRDAVHNGALYQLRGTTYHPERQVGRPLDSTRLRYALHAERLDRLEVDVTSF